MRLTELLNEKAITTRLRARNKRDAIAELVGLLESAHDIDSQGEILDRVFRREAMMSTGIGNGVAIRTARPGSWTGSWPPAACRPMASTSSPWTVSPSRCSSCWWRPRAAAPCM
jgi:hypothetical protein